MDWELAIKTEDFAPIRDTLFNMVVKTTKETIHLQYPDLNLDFLKAEDEEVENTQSETANLGKEGQRAGKVDGAGKGEVEKGKMVDIPISWMIKLFILFLWNK